MAHGQGGAEIGYDRWPTLTCNHEAPIAAYAIQAGALRTNPASGPDGVGVQEDHAYTLEARAEVQAVCVTGQIAHTLKAEGFDASEDGTGRGQENAVALTVSLRGREGGATAELGDEVGNCLRASGGGGDKAHVLAPIGVTIHGTDPTVQKVASYDEISQCLRARPPGHVDNSSTTVALHHMQVRRLTPRECERLQGFPDDYTLIPWRKKPADECPDGPRYKALGNSWAVPNVRWIGRRIDSQLRGLTGYQ